MEEFFFFQIGSRGRDFGLGFLFCFIPNLILWIFIIQAVYKRRKHGGP